MNRPSNPHNTLTKFVDLLGGANDSWIIPTVGLVLLVGFLVSRSRNRRQPELHHVQLWAVSLVGWLFLLPMELLDLVATADFTRAALLLIPAVLILTANLLVANRDPGLGHVAFAVIVAVLVFTAIACLAHTDGEGNPHATTLFMGMLLGFLVSETLINARMWRAGRHHARDKRSPRAVTVRHIRSDTTTQPLRSVH